MTVHRFDLVILGSGSTAFAAALRAAELGKTAAMTESRVLGGTCVNRGCPPVKESHRSRAAGLRGGTPFLPRPRPGEYRG